MRLGKGMDLEGFLASPMRAAWIREEGDLAVYVRRGHRPAAGGGIGVWLDLANMEVDEELRGRGAFGRFLERAEKAALAAELEGVWVENVINERLRGFLERRGYGICGPDREFAPSFSKSAEALSREARARRAQGREALRERDRAERSKAEPRISARPGFVR